MKNWYTLIELMIVVAIIGILAAVAIPAYKDHQFVCRAGFQFDRNSQRQIIGVNGGGIPCAAIAEVRQ